MRECKAARWQACKEHVSLQDVMGLVRNLYLVLTDEQVRLQLQLNARHTAEQFTPVAIAERWVMTTPDLQRPCNGNACLVRVRSVLTNSLQQFVYKHWLHQCTTISMQTGPATPNSSHFNNAWHVFRILMLHSVWFQASPNPGWVLGSLSKGQTHFETFLQV